MQLLLRYLSRQPAAPIIRAKVYERLKKWQPITILGTKTDTTPPTDFEWISSVLRNQLKECSDRERELRNATIQAFPGKQELLRKLYKATELRNEMADEVAFLWRAHKLGFSHDNLSIAVHAAEATLVTLQNELNSYHNELIDRIEATASKNLSCLFA